MALTKKWVIDKRAGEGQFVCYHPVDGAGNIIVGLSSNDISETGELIGEMVEDYKGNIVILPLKGVDLQMGSLNRRLAMMWKSLDCLERAILEVCDGETIKKIQVKQEELSRGTK